MKSKSWGSVLLAMAPWIWIVADVTHSALRWSSPPISPEQAVEYAGAYLVLKTEHPPHSRTDMLLKWRASKADFFPEYYRIEAFPLGSSSNRALVSDRSLYFDLDGNLLK